MEQKIQAKKRIGWIDIAKAIGILFVLINHAELNLGVVTFLGGMFYMPVFFVLSGYTYKDNSQESIKRFIVSKARRLLLPYLCFQLIIVGLFTVKGILARQSVKAILLPILGAIYSRNSLYPKSLEVIVPVPVKNIDLMSVLNAPLWFLTGLFITLILYKFIITLAKGSYKKEWCYLAVSIIIGIVLKYLCPILLPWSIDTAFISVGFVHFGRLMKRNNLVQWFYKKPIYILTLLIGFVVVSYINGSDGTINMSIREFGHSVLMYLFVGGAGSLLVILLSKGIEDYSKITNQLLESVGRHTIGILAFHLGIFILIGVVLNRIGITNEIVVKVVQIIAAIVILVPTDWYIQRYLPFVYGIKRRNE